MVKNLWARSTFYCTNRHLKPVEMHVQQGTEKQSNFYACPKYFLKDDNHPDGHEADEPPCYNRLNFIDAEGVVGKFEKLMEQDVSDGSVEMIDYTGTRFRYKSIDVVVLKYGFDEVRFGVVNQKALRN